MPALLRIPINQPGFNGSPTEVKVGHWLRLQQVRSTGAKDFFDEIC